MGAGERVKGRGDLSLKRSAMQSQTFPVSADIFSTDSAVSMSFTGNSFPKPMGCRFWEMQNKNRRWGSTFYFKMKDVTEEISAAIYSFEYSASQHLWNWAWTCPHVSGVQRTPAGLFKTHTNAESRQTFILGNQPFWAFKCATLLAFLSILKKWLTAANGPCVHTGSSVRDPTVRAGEQIDQLLFSVKSEV